MVDGKFNSGKYRIYDQMISSFYDEEQKRSKGNENAINNIKIEPLLIIESSQKRFKVAFKIGNKQMYKLKSVVDFYDRMQNKDVFKYGMHLEIIHTYETFSEDSIKILEFIMKYAEIMKYASENLNYYHTHNNENYIILNENGMDEFFEIMKNKTLEVKIDGIQGSVKLIDNEPNLKFQINEISEDEYSISTIENCFDFMVVNGKKYIYFLQDKNIYRCTNKFENTVLKLLNIFRVNFTNTIPFKKEEFSELYSLIIPTMRSNFELTNINQDELKQYIPRELKTRVYLDSDQYNRILAEIKFIYDDFDFSPFEDVEIQIPRNVIEESKALDMFSNAGFMFDSKNKKLILENEEKIYNFIKYEIGEMINKFEILATSAFKNREIISPKLTNVGLKVENNLLEIDLTNINIDRKELEEVIKKYRLKKRFHKLKNGQFINLEKNDTLDAIDKILESTNISLSEIAMGPAVVPIYRSFYLDKILKKNNIIIKQNEEYKNLIEDINGRKTSQKNELPNGLNATLREYQQVGYEWLKNLDYYEFGGILADDMGLGKTLQMLAVILSYKENKGKEPSMVICPSSLALNWQEESNRFTPELKTLIISGNSEERINKIKNIKNYDLVITSYDLLKRDVDIYKDCNYTFRYLIADEAQYIKNNKTQNAKAIKQLKAQTRFALTGTPIENSLAELWSIFDFIMPGYLYTYNKFKIDYETPIIKDGNETMMAKLKEIISPFILRRVKEKVLTELPDKTITVLNNEMEGEQEKIYYAYMQNARKQAQEEIQMNGIQNSQIKILALLMRLRQICCHPGLFLEDYNEGSKKLTQCMEIIKDAVDSGHKILLFSGYSSMFPYIKKELEEMKIKYFMLTGQTRVLDRMDLVNEFNHNDDIKVFLISLKAGGTGLNLIGADVVIHYDPWWNISIENQATDRAYRIGQKRNVQVYKLITKNTIEEKIYNLQEKKAKLANDILSTNQTFISKLSEEEIMNLFE